MTMFLLYILAYAVCNIVIYNDGLQQLILESEKSLSNTKKPLKFKDALQAVRYINGGVKLTFLARPQDLTIKEDRRTNTIHIKYTQLTTRGNIGINYTLTFKRAVFRSQPEVNYNSDSKQTYILIQTDPITDYQGIR